ncbi:hypothetical protein M758_UG271000 [Ceratodon purpureus]|nr:hypothetical protein M758_UG271000 [Ceratodon purpureus]
MFNKISKLRSGSRASAQGEGDNDRGSWTPHFGGRKGGKKSVLKGVDLGNMSDSEVVFAETLFHLKSVATTPVKKLQRSKHTLDTSLIPAVLDKYDGLSPRSPVFIASRKSVELVKEYPQRDMRKSWTAEVERAYHSNGDSRRKSCEPVLSSRPRSGDSSRTVASESTFSKRDNSGRSWTFESSTDDDENMDRSMSLASYLSQEEEDANEAAEYADAEERFLQANTGYFETLALENVRQEQYPKLALHRHVYMDYASLALSSRFQMEEHMKIVMAEGHMFGAKTSGTAEYAAMAQARLLKMLNTSRSEYSVVFTTGLKASYRLVANAYPFQKNSPILLCQDNHDAINQLIAAAVKAGGKPVLAPLDETDFTMSKANIRPLMKRRVFQASGSLFVFPAQSSITGIRHSMRWISKARNSGWHVLLDASTLLPTGTLDLMQNQPDFVLGSFQNIVGYPSGMGFLLVRRASFCVDHAPHSNAITLTTKSSSSHNRDCFIVAEDESLSKLSFAGLDLGLEHLQSVGLDVINTRVKALANWMVHTLKGLRHIDPDDWSLVNVYCPYIQEDRGNIISFNVLDSTGEVVLPSLVQRLAAKNQITLAVGSFSNPGVSNLLGPVKNRLKTVKVFEQLPEFQCVQVSLGPMSNFEDAYRVVQFINKFRNQDYVSMEALGFMEDSQFSMSSSQYVDEN